MHVDLKNTGLVPNLPSWEQLQALAMQSESGRFFYTTVTDSFRSIPLYDIDNSPVLRERISQSPVNLLHASSSKAATLQLLNKSLTASPVSPSYQSNEDLFARIDSLWKNDDQNQRTDVIDQAISYLSNSGNPERICLSDLLETIKRKALKATQKGEAM